MSERERSSERHETTCSLRDQGKDGRVKGILRCGELLDRVVLARIVYVWDCESPALRDWQWCTVEYEDMSADGELGEEGW